ncbi:hypothetical protein QO058_07310 [Bosea vestrisii]|uniref:hypothetical protein n=1 Tax=Bosea vestrisii TaxID=151416 RepID=UPI0024DFCA79|nr:hypothetical protein [Bosea vestrisii]WID98043.1 hypothetical protein QO058_07310 [Bosea vestrisii]
MILGDGNPHFLHSTLREKIAEHLFVGELLRRLWQLGVFDAEVLRSEFDAGGYDLVLSCREIVRHIQFKTIIAGGKAQSVKLSLRLAEKPSGCAVWMVLGQDLTIRSFFWFGGEPGQPLPDIQGGKIARHTKADATGKKAGRENHRVVARSRFDEVPSLDKLITKLLGTVNVPIKTDQASSR